MKPEELFDVQGGAAVRGEAVALTDDFLLAHFHERGFYPENLSAKLRPSFYDAVRALVSPRAADALDSQPTDDERALRTGRNLLDYAKRLGWPDDGEGAFEFLQRKFFIAGMDSLRLSQPAASASQESIGDDAKFVGLLKRSSELYNMSAAYENGYGEATAALIAYIDSRAPAAQAASVAPDGFVLEGYYRKNGKHFDRLKSLPNDCTLSSGWVAHYVPAPQQEGSEAGNG